MVRMADIDLLAQIWVGDDTGGLERCTVEVERSDLDEVRLGITESDDEDGTTHVYLARDRALRLGHALIEQALTEWRMP
jgi:hypothetical protein